MEFLLNCISINNDNSAEPQQNMFHGCNFFLKVKILLYLLYTQLYLDFNLKYLPMFVFCFGLTTSAIMDIFWLVDYGSVYFT